MTASYFSQHGEDCWIDRHLKLPATGVFVDVGAHDGIIDSNTLFFERKGWTGLCVEAHPQVVSILTRNRTCRVGAYAICSDPTRLFEVHPIQTWSGFGRGGLRIQVPIKRLEEALGENQIEGIDLLSIDVEGSELDVWSTFDCDRHRPRVVILEYLTQPLPSQEEAIMDAFYSLPYRMVHRTPANLIFERQE